MIIYLLGTPFIRLEHSKVSVSSSRAFLLLVYLAHHSEWIKRDELAFFLRPDVDRETGQQYLRKLLSNARKIPWAQSLEVEAERLRWQVETDVRHFQQARSAGHWREAVQLYRGPFMGHIDVPFLPSYNAWLQLEREVLDHEWQEATLNLARDLESAGQHREAAAVAKKLLDYDAFHENALQSYLRNVYFIGQRERALKTALKFEVRLRDELNVEPTPATRQLVEAIRLAKPLEKVTSPLRYGRRRGDRVQTFKASEGPLDELTALLEVADSRLVSVGPSDGDKTTFIIAKRVADTSTALLSVVHLAAQLMDKQHKGRALELLLLVLNHPACDASLEDAVAKIWPGLDKLANQ